MDFDIEKISAIVAGESGLSRLEEIVQFAKLSGHKKIGLAHCIMLSRQAEQTRKFIEYNGLEVVLSVCKIGNIPKTFLGLKSGKPICNPIAQAQYFNEVGTELNIVLGLCVGHDTLFFKHSNAPVTVLAVKDKVHHHNPLAALEGLE